MLTALGSEDDRVAGLELGADDYIAKPFSPREVITRVKAVLRRARPQTGMKDMFYQGDLIVEDTCLIVTFRGTRLTLSGPEWEILRRLAESLGQVVAQEELITLLWGQDGLVHEHELARYVQALKQKLENQYAGLIGTVPGVGYRLTSHRH